MACDGQILNVPDTPENAAAFGRHSGGRGAGAYPQVQAVYLVELGSHAVVDAAFYPCHTDERTGLRRLLRSVGPGMLVLLERGLYAAELVAALRARGAHVLARLPASVQPVPVPDGRRADGSWLAWVQQARVPQPAAARVLVRVIDYVLEDPQPGVAPERHRLITTLGVEPPAGGEQSAPARALVCTDHERWESELTADELETHQIKQLPAAATRPVLRSRKPAGVLPELYGLLLAHYAVRFLTSEAAAPQGLAPERLSFTRAVRVLREATLPFQLAAPELWPALYEQLLADLRRERLPPRRPRRNPRVVKCKLSNFPLKREAHRHWPQPTGSFQDTVRLI